PETPSASCSKILQTTVHERGFLFHGPTENRGQTFRSPISTVPSCWSGPSPRTRLASSGSNPTPKHSCLPKGRHHPETPELRRNPIGLLPSSDRRGTKHLCRR